VASRVIRPPNFLYAVSTPTVVDADTECVVLRRSRPRTLVVVTGLGVLTAVAVGQLAAPPPTRSIGATATYEAVADTFANAADPNEGRGTHPLVKVDGGWRQRVGYLRFSLDDSGGQRIRSVTLRLFAASDAPLGVAVHTVTGSWREATLTHADRPPPGRMIGHSGAVRGDRWTEIDVTGSVARAARGGGSASLALVHSPFGAAGSALALQDRVTRRFASRETDHAPQLVVVYGDPPNATTSTMPRPTTTATVATTTSLRPAPPSTAPRPTVPPAPSPLHRSIAPGRSGSFRFDGYGPLADRPLTVWYDAPADLSSARVLIVMHGQSRTGQDYRDSWIPHARAKGALLIVPEFSEAFYPGSDAYNLGDMERQPESRWSFSVIEPLFDHVRADTGNRSDGYLLYGHSAGAQFVHRFLLFKPQNRVTRAVAANAGWYTTPELAVDFPYGMRGSPSSEAGLRGALATPLTVLLGENDTDPNDPDLRHTAGADRQGPHRFARGHFFFAAGGSTARALGAPFAWTLATVPGATHSNGEMAPAAARLLLG
jgi:hypothetical protein